MDVPDSFLGWGLVSLYVSKSYITVYPKIEIPFCKLLAFNMLHDPTYLEKPNLRVNM